MVNYIKKLVIILALILLMHSFTNESGFIYAKTQAQDTPEGYSIAASNDYLTLYYNTNSASIAVRDNSSGYLWTSVFPEAEYPEGNITRAIVNELNSLFILRYSEMNLINSKDITEPLASLEYTLDTSLINNGVKFKFLFTQLSLEVAINFSIERDSLIVDIPYDNIREAVGTKEVIQERISGLYYFLDFLSNELITLSNDESIPDSYKRDIPRLKNLMDSISSKAKEIPDAMGIEIVSNNLNKSLNEIQNLYAGSLSNIGIYNRIILSESISESKKNYYKNSLTYIEDQMSMARLSVSSIRTITVGGVVAISVLPYFGAAGDFSDGYVFYPDGSGAITRFTSEHPSYSFGYTKDIYSDDTPNIDWEKSKQTVGIRNTHLPVLGIRKDGAAFVSYIENGDSSSRVNFYPSGFITNINRAYFTFLYRRKMVRDREAGVLQQGSANEIYELELNRIDFKNRYMFLNNENADYSGMANRLRNHMIENDMLVKSKAIDEKLIAGIELFGGVEQMILIYKDFIPMTTFDQAGKILSDLSGYKDLKLLVNYRGWSENGIDKFPTSVNPSRKLGGINALGNLSEFVNDSGNILFLEGNFIEAQAGQSGYNSGELALSSNLRPIASSVSLNWIITPNAVYNRIQSYFDVFKNFGISGITYDKIGTFIYYDYSTEQNKKISREGTSGTWRKILESTQTEIGNTAVIGGNAYTFSNADWIIRAPKGSSEYVFYSENVPFYQMLIRGSIPYTLKPFNNFYDYEYEKLTTIEYGGTPYFLLSHEEATRLGDLSVDMFTGRYDDIKEYIKESIEEFIVNFSNISDSKMIYHDRPVNNFAVIKYDNNTDVFINYNNHEIVYDGHNVSANSYLVVGRERSISYEQEIFYNETQGISFRLPVYIAVASGVLVLLCISVVLFRRSGIQSDNRYKNK